MKIGARLTILFFTLAVLSISIIGVLSYHKAKKSLKAESFNRLTAVREMKAAQIEDYFQEIRNQVITLSESHSIIEAMTDFKAGFNQVEQDIVFSQERENSLKDYYTNEFLPKLNPNLPAPASVEDFWPSNPSSLVLQELYISSNPHPLGGKHELTTVTDSCAYSKAHQIYHPILRNFSERFGYYDLFLVDDKTGNIVYSVFKEVDFATSLFTGPFANTNFARTLKHAVSSDKKDFISIADFEPYGASYNAHAAFIASPIYSHGERIGVLIFQMPIDRINDIMTSHEEWTKVGLGNSGETYLVGSDYTLRNQSRFLIEDRENYFKMIEGLGVSADTISMIKNFNSTVGLQKVKTEGTLLAIEGESNTKTFRDYRGVKVLSAYKPLEIKELDWVILSEIDEEEAFASVNALRSSIIGVFAILIILIIGTSLLFSRSITKPLKALTNSSKELARGNLDAEIPVERGDEIGILALSFKSMRDAIHKLVDDLKDINANLENKVTERTQELQEQRDLMEEKNIEILDSINYAQRLQQAILPPIDKISDKLNEFFILFKPKDIVSGDFYWMANKNGKVLIAAVDCTGHGVPGAMVSVVGSNGLYRCVKEFGLSKPAAILDKLAEIVIETFAADGQGVKDGMDISLCAIDPATNTVEFAGANNPLWIAKKGIKEIEEFIEIKADKQPIGAFDHLKPFTNHKVQLEKGDSIFMFTDGYADQFGGEKGKKLKYKPFKQLIADIITQPMDEQKGKLDSFFEEWKGKHEQIDDVCIIGVRMQ